MLLVSLGFHGLYDSYMYISEMLNRIAKGELYCCPSSIHQ